MPGATDCIRAYPGATDRLDSISRIREHMQLIRCVVADLRLIQSDRAVGADDPVVTAQREAAPSCRTCSRDRGYCHHAGGVDGYEALG